MADVSWNRPPLTQAQWLDESFLASFDSGTLLADGETLRIQFTDAVDRGSNYSNDDVELRIK